MAEYPFDKYPVQPTAGPANNLESLRSKLSAMMLGQHDPDPKAWNPYAGQSIMQGAPATSITGLMGLLAGGQRPDPNVSYGAIPFRIGQPKVSQDTLDQLIANRNKLYHATTQEGLEGIVKEGKIKPSDVYVSFETHADPKLRQQWQQLENAKKLIDTEYGEVYNKSLIERGDTFSIEDTLALNKLALDKGKLLDQQNSLVSNWHQSGEAQRVIKGLRGVSVSRVPKYSGGAYGEAPFTLELDPSKVPPNRPFAEEGFQKTKYPRSYYSSSYGPNPEKFPELAVKIPNNRFEFENRTYNEPIPANAITKIMVDKSMAKDPIYGQYLNSINTGIRERAEYNLKGFLDPLSQKLGVPYEWYEGSPEIHRYRSKLGIDILRDAFRK